MLHNIDKIDDNVELLAVLRIGGRDRTLGRSENTKETLSSARRGGQIQRERGRTECRGGRERH